MKKEIYYQAKADIDKMLAECKSKEEINKLSEKLIEYLKKFKRRKNE